MPAILVTWEADIRGLRFKASSDNSSRDHTLKVPITKGLAEWLKVKALSSSPSTKKKKKKKKKRKISSFMYFPTNDIILFFFVVK
jgi:hypothetical protein